MAEGNHNLGTIRGTIKIDYDGAGVVKAIKDTDRVKKSGDKLSNTSNKILGAFSSFAKGSVKLAAGANLITNSVHLVAGAIATLGPIASAGMAVLPGIALSGFAAMTVLKVATLGVSDALKNAGADSKKFEASIKGLSPQAQKFAIAFRNAYPQLLKVKNVLQDAFFKGTARQVGGVVKSVTQITPAAAGVARNMSAVAQNIVKFVTSSKSINGIKTILGGVSSFLNRIKGSFGPLIQAFIVLGAQASTFAGTLGGTVAGAVSRFTGFLNSINIKDLFATALPIIQSLVGLFQNVGSIAQSVFSIFTTSGGGAASILTTLTGTMAAFLKSAQGKAALDAIGTALATISSGAGQVFLALLQALAPAIVALAPGVTTLATQITGLLVPAINFLAPALSGIATFLSQNMSWLGPVAGAVVGLAGAYKVWAAGASAVSSIQDLLRSKVITATGAWIANTASVVANKVAQAASATVTGVQAVAAWVASTAAMVANRAVGVAIAAMMAGQMVASWVASTAAIVANRVATIAGTVAMYAVRAAVVTWTAVQWLLNAALNANPIGLIVLAIVALVAGIILAYKHSATFRAIVQAVWAAIKVAISAVVNWITGTVWPALKAAWDAIANAAVGLWHFIVNAFNGIKAGITAAINAVKAVISAVWNAIVFVVKAYINAYKTVIMAGFNAAKAVVNAVMNAVKSVVSSIWNTIVSVIRGNINAIKAAIANVRSVVTTVRNAFNEAKNAAANAINALIGVVRSLPGKVTGALGNLGSLLYDKGRSLVEGLVNGIKSMAGKVKDAAKGLVGGITKYLPGSPAKEGPLSGRGYVMLRAQRFMNDFATGIKNGSGKPLAAINATVNPIARTIPTTGSAARSAASNTGPSFTAAPATRTYRIAIGEKIFADLVVDAVTGKPKAMAKAAAEGARQSAWAGSGR